MWTFLVALIMIWTQIRKKIFCAFPTKNSILILWEAIIKKFKIALCARNAGDNYVHFEIEGFEPKRFARSRLAHTKTQKKTKFLLKSQDLHCRIRLLMHQYVNSVWEFCSCNFHEYRAELLFDHAIAFHKSQAHKRPSFSFQIPLLNYGRKLTDAHALPQSRSLTDLFHSGEFVNWSSLECAANSKVMSGSVCRMSGKLHRTLNSELFDDIFCFQYSDGAAEIIFIKEEK